MEKYPKIYIITFFEKRTNLLIKLPVEIKLITSENKTRSMISVNVPSCWSYYSSGVSIISTNNLGISHYHGLWVQVSDLFWDSDLRRVLFRF